jgi:fibronectin-binding autotransporter adhesin
MIRLSFKSLALGLLTLACLASASTASAGTLTTWSGTAAGTLWSTNGNWTTKPTTSGTFSLVYSGTPTRTTSQNDIGPGAVKVDSILFANTGATGSTATFILSRSSTSPALSLLNGATVTTTAATSGTLSDTISSGIAFGGTATLNIGSLHNLTLTGTLSDGGSLVKTGAGDLLLTGTNNLAALQIDQGVVQANATAFGGITGLTVDIGSSGQTGTLRTSGVGSALATVSTNMQFKLNGNADIIPNSSSNITFTAANFNTAVNGVTTPVRLSLLGGTAGSNGTQIINGVIKNNSGSGTVSVTIGTGNSQNFWVLNGMNTYTGSTTIQSGGKLLMNGSVAAGSTTTSYGYLGGSGTFGGAVIVSSGTLAPGGSSLAGSVTATVSALTMASLSLGSTATTQLTITGSTSALYDQLIGSSTLNYGGTLALTMSTATTSYGNGTFFNLFTGFTGSPTGNLSTVTLDAVGTDFGGLTFRSYNSMTTDEQAFLTAQFGAAAGDWYSDYNVGHQRLVFSQSSGTLSVVPEPSTCAMALAGLAYGGWQIFRRRRLRQAPALAA